MFTDVQYIFTRHLRDPETQPAPADIPEERMAVYCDLVYRNIERMISNLFPILRKVTMEDRWQAMVRDYLKSHQSHSPLFNKIPQEFLQYLEQERDTTDDPPFMPELAHYEWVEYAVTIDTRDIVWDGIDTVGDLLEGIPVISPLVWPLRYTYPVHRISPDYLPVEPPVQPTYLVVYRDRHDHVGFIELNPVSARLLELIRAGGNATGGSLLHTIAGELQHPQPDVVINGGLETMRNLLSKDVLLGVKA